MTACVAPTAPSADMVTCLCCGVRYDRRHWTCCGPQALTFNGPPLRSEVWLAQFCARPQDGGCGKCPRHCRCDRARVPTRDGVVATMCEPGVVTSRKVKTA